MNGGFMLVPKILVFSSFLLLCGGAPTYAAISDDFGEADELLLFQDMTLVVSASRQKQPENLLSVPVSVLTADDLHYGGYTSIPEALRYTPGVDVVRLDRNRHAIGIRGLEGSFSDRMMTLVDGMPADSPVFGGPLFSSLPIMMEDIERIEVVRGSGGAAWGANALTGVINIITKDPEAVPGLFLTSTVSEFGDSSSQARFADVSGKWSWLLSAGYEDVKSSADILDSAAAEGATDFQRRNVARGELVYKTESQLELTFGAGMTSTDQGGFATSGVDITNDNQFDTVNGYVKASKVFSPETEGYVRWAGRYHDMDRPSFGDAKYRVFENDIETQVNLTGLDKHSLALGGNIRTSIIDSKPVAPDTFTLAGENAYENWAGLFGSDRYQYSRQLLFEAQLRGDYFSEGKLDWSGRVSSIYGLDSSMAHVLRLSAAKSYRQPVGLIRDPVFFSDTMLAPASFTLSVDPDMNSEQAWSLEGGYQWSIQENFRFKADLYYMWYDGLIGGQTDVSVSATGTPLYDLLVTNSGDADGYGVEMELDYTAGSVLWSVWYAYNNFETEFEYQSIRAFLPAKNKIGVNMRWAVDHNWKVNGQYAYSDRVQEDVSEAAIEAAHHLDLNVSRSLFSQKGEIMVGVMDLLNEEYDPVSGLDDGRQHTIPGRTFFLRAQYTF
jgi:iron complex outermembrane receptor protein